MRVLPMVKETYHQVSETEYQAINPYIEGIGIVRQKYPDAKIVKFKTITDVFGAIQYPLLLVYFEVNA